MKKIFIVLAVIGASLLTATATENLIPTHAARLCKVPIGWNTWNNGEHFIVAKEFFAPFYVPCKLLNRMDETNV